MKRVKDEMNNKEKKLGVDLNQLDFWIRPRTLPQNVRLNEVQVTTSDQELPEKRHRFSVL